MKLSVLAACAVAACVLVSSAGMGIARAANGRTKVTIETDPPGAKVYFNLKEDGEVCTTPCTVDAPIGETVMIIEAENCRPLIENLVVKRRTARPVRMMFKLEPAVGTLVIEGGDGAAIRIDDKDEGVAPREIENVPAGGHHITLVRDSVVVHDQFIEIEAGGTATIQVPAAAAVVAAPTAPASGVKTQATGEPAARRPMAIALGATANIGFRQFNYRGNQTEGTQRDNVERGQILIGPIIEVWPTTLVGSRLLPGLRLFGRFEIGVNPQSVQIQGSMPVESGLTTSWQSFEASALHRWTIAEKGTIEVGAGYVEDRFRFTGDADNVAIVPDAVYRAVRIGGRASLLFSGFEPYFTVENRVVLDGGAMEKRYDFASVYGVRGSLGGALHIGRLGMRLEGGLTLYSWTFRTSGDSAMIADGGRDMIQNVSLSVGYYH